MLYQYLILYVIYFTLHCIFYGIYSVPLDANKSCLVLSCLVLSIDTHGLNSHLLISDCLIECVKDLAHGYICDVTCQSQTLVTYCHLPQIQF